MFTQQHLAPYTDNLKQLIHEIVDDDSYQYLSTPTISALKKTFTSGDRKNQKDIELQKNIASFYKVVFWFGGRIKFKC